MVKSRTGKKGQEKLQTPSRKLAVVVDDLTVTYRVFGAAVYEGKPSLINRMINLGRPESGSITKVTAVRNVSFSVFQGEAVGIVGTNGSGKSTLLRAVAGLIPAASGRVFVSSSPALLGVNAALMPSLTGERNIMIGGLALGLERHEVKDNMDSVAEFSEIGDFLHFPMSAYSSGMGARLRFAINTIKSPDILMIDEGLATGDAAFMKKSLTRLEEIKENAGTIFFVSHGLQAVRDMCTRALWLDQGELIMDGDVDEVADAYHAFTQTLTNATAGARLFTKVREAPAAPIVAPLPPEINRTAALEVSWTPDPDQGGFQRQAEVAVTAGNNTWTPGGLITGTETSKVFTDAKNHALFSQRNPVEIRVRTWGLASQGGADGQGASPWSEPQFVSFIDD